MPTDPLLENITSLLIGLPNQYSMYSSQSLSTGSYSKESANLQEQIQDLNLKIQDLDRQEETYDREFLDRKNNPPTVGLFNKMGLRTTEDWVIAYFFFSYFVFVLLCLINVLIYSTKKVFASAAVIGVGLLFEFVSLLLLYRYA
jgi:Flp pilus assembly protein TadB